jgi:hypothetical protein
MATAELPFEEVLWEDPDYLSRQLITYIGNKRALLAPRHLLPGNEDEAAALLDAFLERANTAARVAQLN